MSITNKKKKISLLILLGVIALVFFIYFSIKKSIPINELEFREDFLLVRTISILSINFGFLSLMFLIDIHHYKKLLIIVIIIGIITYFLSIIGTYLDAVFLNGDFFEFIVFLTYAIVPPGIIVNILYYIKNFRSDFRKRLAEIIRQILSKNIRRFGEYH